MSIVENIHAVQMGIADAVKRRDKNGHKGQAVKLVAVTKNQTVTLIKEAINAGVTAIGENRVQEASGKLGEIGRGPEWHLIGHLQTNKAKVAVSMFDLIHSVDSVHLARELNKEAAKLGKRQQILIQVNIAEEETKFGIESDKVDEMVGQVLSLPNLELKGFMTIAPFFEKPEMARPVFRQMYKIFKSYQDRNLPGSSIEWLSMGMTNDYQIAIEEGSNLVRVGTAIFGPRIIEEA